MKSENQGIVLGSGSRLPVAQPSSNTTTIQCPECGSQRVWKDGMRHTPFGEIQRYLCRECGYRFSNIGLPRPSQTVPRLILSRSSNELFYRSRLGDVSDTGKAALTSTTKPKPKTRRDPSIQDEAVNDMETRTQETAAGATTPDLATVKGKLVEFSFWLQKQGYAEGVTRFRTRVIKRLVDLGANLWDPETIKEILAKQRWNDGYKMQIVYAYENFVEMEKLAWIPPGYTQPETLPFIPTETEIDQLISACGKKVGTFLQGLKDTGADPGELAVLRWIDINKETRTVNIKPVKGHNPRILPVSQQFIDRIERLPKNSEKIFKLANLTVSFYQQRKRLVNKFANPRLLEVSFRTLRHWKGTMEYHRTRDILYVKKILGHKCIQNTLIYIDLEAALFMTTNDQFTTRVAENVREACELVEAGFEYVTGEYNDGGKIFRKRK